MAYILGYADHFRSTIVWLRERARGFTLVELMVVVAILGTLTAIAIPTYTGWIQRARTTKAIAEIGILQREIGAYEADNDALPNTLNDIRRGTLLDPWGNPYQFLNFATIKGKGEMRKDRFLVPLNTDYDLCSMGRDGQSKPPLTANASHDDIVRANNGAYIGLASEY